MMLRLVGWGLCWFSMWPSACRKFLQGRMSMRLMLNHSSLLTPRPISFLPLDPIWAPELILLSPHGTRACKVFVAISGPATLPATCGLTGIDVTLAGRFQVHLVYSLITGILPPGDLLGTRAHPLSAPNPQSSLRFLSSPHQDEAQSPLLGTHLGIQDFNHRPPFPIQGILISAHLYVQSKICCHCQILFCSLETPKPGRYHFLCCHQY